MINIKRKSDYTKYFQSKFGNITNHDLTIQQNSIILLLS